MSNLSAIETIANNAMLAGAMAENIPSPCASVCQMDRAGLFCQGCLRSIDEISAWSRASTQQKKQIWAQIAERAERLRANLTGPDA